MFWVTRWVLEGLGLLKFQMMGNWREKVKWRTVSVWTMADQGTKPRDKSQEQISRSLRACVPPHFDKWKLSFFQFLQPKCWSHLYLLSFSHILYLIKLWIPAALTSPWCKWLACFAVSIDFQLVFFFPVLSFCSITFRQAAKWYC